MTNFERFQEYGRLRQIAKDADPYALVFEEKEKLYIALSTGQIVRAGKFRHMKDHTVLTWLQLLFNIGFKRTA